MFNRRMFAIMKREMKAQIFSKAFIFMTILMPVIMFGAMFFMTFVMQVDDEKATYMQVVSTNDIALEAVRYEMEGRESSSISMDFIKINSDINAYIDERRSFLLEDSIEAVIYLTDSTLVTKEFDYFSKSSNQQLRRSVRNIIQSALLKEYLKTQNIGENQIKYIQKSTSSNLMTVKSDSTGEDEGPAKFIIAGLFAFLLYLSVLMIGMTAMRSTTEEKINRVVEVLLSSVNTKELMAGKILGATVTGLVQMGIWLAPVMLLSLTTLIALPDNINIDLSIWQFLYFFSNFVIGLVTFVGLFAAVGAIFDNDQDAQQGVMPLMMLIMIPFYIAIGTIINPGNSIAEITSLIPFFSIIVMPVKMSLIETPVWQLFAQLGINLVVMYACIVLAAKIYHVAILITGKKPSWKQIFKWLKEA